MGKSPRRRMSAPVRVFTLKEASDVLPDVREHIVWLSAAIERISSLQDRAAVLEVIGARDADSPEHAELHAVRRDLEEQVRRYNERLEEFQQVGCLIKDLRSGLVDFYCRKDGRLVFLCWKLGEDDIRHWHEINAGFHGRRSVTEFE